MSTVINNETYVEILEARRLYGEYGWITRQWSVPPYRYSLERSPAEIKESIYHSYKIHQIVTELSKDKSSRDVEDKVKQILDEMCHNFQMGSIRFTGYILAKILKRIYKGIYVNVQGVEKVRQVSTQCPILYMPTHRSYADFLLVSYVCYNFNLPLPTIAAGIDFLGLKFVSTLLRNCGAFFIRRHFADDKLYWTIFSVYLQSLLEGGEHPVEFFVEGTRSRTAKSLTPKLGLLQAALELYFTAKVPDLTIIPISISYERTLEEDLFAYELLGIPKPKESTRGLVKARKILDKNFGNIYFKLGDPISVRDFCGTALDRSYHNLQPKFEVSLNPIEVLMCSDLAHHVIQVHQRNLVVTPLSALCLLVGNACAHDVNIGISFSELAEKLEWIRDLLNQAGFATSWQGPLREEDLLLVLNDHAKILQVLQNGQIGVPSMLNKMAEHSKVSSSIPGSGISSQQTTISLKAMFKALPHILLSHYSNQVLQLLIHLCMVAACLECSLTKSTSEENLFNQYKVLRRLLCREFVFERAKEKDDFSQALMILQAANLVSPDPEDHYQSVSSSASNLSLLAEFLSPFLTCYSGVCNYLLHRPRESGVVPQSSKSLSQECQQSIEMASSNNLYSDTTFDYRTLSLDTISNCLLMLVKEKAIIREKSEDGTFLLLPILSEISRVTMDLAPFVKPKEGSREPTLILPLSKI